MPLATALNSRIIRHVRDLTSSAALPAPATRDDEEESPTLSR
jgi:hypothetical protein